MSGADDRTRRIFAGAYEIFRVAVDEMRHFRWVNEVLELLEQPPSLGRAERIGRTFDRPFDLKPLTPEQLQWFIDVEKPSQAINEGIDGMYVRLHTSIDRQPDVFHERDRLVHLIKLIIDEGGDHYERFSAVQKHFSGMQPDEYLRTLEDPPPGSMSATLQDLSDQNYAVLLGTLQVAFSLGDRAGGILLEQARRAMFNLHERNHHLASMRVRGRFTLPPPAPALPLAAEAAHTHVDNLASSMFRALSAVTTVGEETERVLAERQRRINEALFERMHQLIREDLWR
jgi:Ferritin-like